MTTTNPITFRTFVREPFDLALGQPHQILISSASVAIVAAEAVHIVPLPFNIALAIGAEWAYLRGLISGAGVKTPWAARLNWAAFLLVVLYGALAGLRGFHLIPDAPPWGIAVLLTAIHIGAISAVTLCSAMLHRAGEDAKAEIQRDIDERQQRLLEQTQAEEQALTLEMKRKQQDLELWKQAQEIKMQLKMQAQNAPHKMRRDAHSERTNAEPQICPKCKAELERSKWLAARRWGHCAACKD